MHLFSLTLLLLLASCSKDAKKSLSGKRESILKSELILKKDPDAANMLMDTPENRKVKAWSQQGFNASHQIPATKITNANKVSWSRRIGFGNTFTRSLTATPVSDGQKVYVLDASGDVEAFNLEGGESAWKNKANNTAKHSGGGLALDGKFLFISRADGELLCLNSSNGELVYRHETKELLRSAPLVHEQHVYVITVHNKVLCYDKQGFELLWTHSGSSESLTFVGGAATAVKGKSVVIPYSSGEVFSLYKLNGLPLWFEETQSQKNLNSTSLIRQFVAHPVIDDETVYLVSHSDTTLALNLKTGERLWHKAVGGTQTPVVAGRFFLMLTSSNELLSMTKDSGRITWIASLPSKTKSSTVDQPLSWFGPRLINDKVLVVSSEGDFRYYNFEDGQLLETHKLLLKPAFSPIFVQNKIIVLSRNGFLTVLE